MKKSNLWGFEHEKPKKKKKDLDMSDVAKTSLAFAGTALAVGIGAKILKDL
jgi:hypothetical protein